MWINTLLSSAEQNPLNLRWLPTQKDIEIMREVKKSIPLDEDQAYLSGADFTWRQESYVSFDELVERIYFEEKSIDFIHPCCTRTMLRPEKEDDFEVEFEQFLSFLRDSILRIRKINFILDNPNSNN